jgi:hypothetical protein
MNYYYSGQGSLYAAKRNTTTGQPLGFVEVGNVPELTIDIEVSKFEHKESQTGGRNLDLTLVKEKKGKFKIKMESITGDNLAIGLYGASSVVAGGTVTDEKVKFFAGMRMPLAHPGVSAVVVKDDAGTVTYVIDDDYAVDLRNGVLIFPATGATPAEGDTLTLAYEYAGYTNLEAFTQAVSPERWLRFEGLNTVDDSSVIVDCCRAQFDPLTGYSLINEDIAAIDMTGSLLADPFITGVGLSKFFRERIVDAV